MNILNVSVAFALALSIVGCGASATTTPNAPNNIVTTGEAEIYTTNNSVDSEPCKSDAAQPWVVNGSEEHYETEAAAVNAATKKFTKNAHRSIRQLCPNTTIALSGIRLLDDNEVATNK